MTFVTKKVSNIVTETLRQKKNYEKLSLHHGISLFPCVPDDNAVESEVWC